MKMKSFVPLSLVVIAMLIVAGCQSCQDTSEPPKPAAQKPAPAAGQPAGQPPAASDEVDEDALVLLAEGEPEDGTAPLSVKFVVESLLVDEMKGPKYKWDFGDGSPVSTEVGPTHVYQNPGSYTAVIRIVDAEGQLGWDEVDIEVEEP